MERSGKVIPRDKGIARSFTHRSIIRGNIFFDLFTGTELDEYERDVELCKACNESFIDWFNAGGGVRKMKKGVKAVNKIERHMDICKHLNGVYERKNHDYGDSFHDTFVEEGMAMARIRLSDKLGRFKKLSREGSEQKVNDESIRDTLLDLANYAIMTVMEMDILAEEEHHNNLMNLGKDSLLNKTFQQPKSSFQVNFFNNGNRICPACGNVMEYHPETDKYTCGKCGTMYTIKASNGSPELDEYPCNRCTYPGKVTCLGCKDWAEWKVRQRSDTDAVETEQADGR